MKNIFTMPVMNISLFQAQDVIKTSGIEGTPVEDVAITNVNNRLTATWNTTGNILEFTR